MSAVLVAPAMTPAWRRSLSALGLVLLALLLLYRDTALAMGGIWMRSETFAHAFLVPPIVLWLMWRRREHVAVLTPRAQPWILLPMALAALGWLIADLAGVNAGAQLMFTVMLVLSVPAVLGMQVARALLFPLAFLFFMVPIGEFLMPALMEATADFTVLAVSLSGVPVYREGLQFIIPSGAWSVVEACSGVRYLIASFMVGTLFAYLNYSSPKRRFIFGLVSLAMPVVANWLRAYMIVMLGHLSDNRIAAGVDHLIYGWVFFGVVILLMFWVGSRWSEPEVDAPAPTPVALQRSEAGSVHSAWAVALAAAALLALPQAAVWQLEHASSGAAPQLSLPDLPGTAPTPEGVTPFAPVTLGPAAEASRSYGVGSAAVTVHVAYYRHQGYGHKLVSSENMLVKSDSHIWNRSAGGLVVLERGSGSLTLRSAELLSGSMLGTAGRKRLDVRQIYWVDGQFTASDARATVMGLWGRLSGRGDDGAMITFYTEGEAREGTGARLDGFISDHLGALTAHLAQVRAAR